MRFLTEQDFIERITRNINGHLEASGIKDNLKIAGYDYTISLYGVIYNSETERNEFRRIEVFINGSPAWQDTQAIIQFFREFKPFTYYSIWAYNKDVKQIVEIKGWQ